MERERKQLSILFLISRTRILRNGETAIRVRISYNGYAAESQISRTVPVKQWSQTKGRSIGRDRAANQLNAYLDIVRMKIQNIHYGLERNGELYSAKLIRDIYAGKKVEVITLKSVFKEHNERCHKLVASGALEAKTAGRYDRCLLYLMECIKIQYKKDDIGLNEINPALVENFELYLKTEKGCSHNTTIQYMKRFKKVVTYARANGWMTCNPFVEVRFKEAPTHKELLSQEEVDLIENKEMAIQRLAFVRDVFIFCCYTGLAFTDVDNLRKEHIMKDSKGNVWIRKTREKTNNMCGIPLLPIAVQMLEKYEGHPVCVAKGTLLPMISNQKMNAYLKEIADICGITKKVTTHTARHTFASIISMGNDAALTNVSSMMGHSTTRMTQRYAKVLDSSILRDMKNVETALANRN